MRFILITSEDETFTAAGSYENYDTVEHVPKLTDIEAETMGDAIEKAEEILRERMAPALARGFFSDDQIHTAEVIEVTSTADLLERLLTIRNEMKAAWQAKRNREEAEKDARRQAERRAQYEALRKEFEGQ